MRVAITGASGLVGTALTGQLVSDGVDVIRMVRRTAGPGEVRWSPDSAFDASGLTGIDAVVHLAGESVAGRWTRTKRRRMWASRVDATVNLCRHLARLPEPPATLLAASAIGIYGDRGDEQLDESSPPGEGFLAELAKAWEAATEPAREAGIRICHCRFGMILSPDGGALQSMLGPFRWGLGGPIGDGRQYWSWIAIDDCVRALRFCLDSDSMAGPVNFVSPNPVRNKEFVQELSRVLRRPAVIPVPKTLLRLVLGDMAKELLLASARVLPRKLSESGFSFHYPDLRPALEHLLS